MYKKKKRFVFMGKRSKNEKRFIFVGKNKNIPNKITVETLEKSERGEDLYRADNIEQLFNELRKKEKKKSDRLRIFKSSNRDE